MTDTNNQPTQLNPTRRWWQFSLRMLLALMFGFVCVFAYYGHQLQRERYRVKAMEQVKQLGGTLQWDTEDPNLAHLEPYFGNTISDEQLVRLFNTLNRLDAITLRIELDNHQLRHLPTLHNLLYVRLLLPNPISDQELFLFQEMPRLRLADLPEAKPNRESHADALSKLKAARPQLTVVFSQIPIMTKTRYHFPLISSTSNRTVLWQRNVQEDLGDLSLNPLASGDFTKTGKIFYADDKLILYFPHTMLVYTKTGKLLWKKVFEREIVVVDARPQIGIALLEKMPSEKVPSTDEIEIQELLVFDSQSGEERYRTKDKIPPSLILQMSSIFQIGNKVAVSGREQFTVVGDPEMVTYYFSSAGKRLEKEKIRIWQITQMGSDLIVVSDGRVQRIDPDETVIWTYTLETTGLIYPQLEVLPRGDSLLLLYENNSSNTTLLCLDPQNGTRKWKYRVAFDARMSDNLIGGKGYCLQQDQQGIVLVGTPCSGYQACKISNDDGAVIWKWQNLSKRRGVGPWKF